VGSGAVTGLWNEPGQLAYQGKVPSPSIPDTRKMWVFCKVKESVFFLDVYAIGIREQRVLNI